MMESIFSKVWGRRTPVQVFSCLKICQINFFQKRPPAATSELMK